MAAVKDNEQCAVVWQWRYKSFVQSVAADLARPLVVHRDNGVVETRITIAIRVLDLPTMTRVVEETAGVWFGDQPVHGGKDIFAVWKEWAARIWTSSDTVD